VRKKTANLTGRNLQLARKLLLDVVSLFEKNSINYHLEGGTLLGIVRDNDLLPWDHDVDISVPDSDVSKLKTLGPELLKLGYKFSKRKSHLEFGPINRGSYSLFKVKPMLKYLGHMVAPHLFYDLIVLDIFIKSSDETYTYWQAQGKVMRVESKYYESYELVPYRGVQLRAPNLYRDYLTEKYGDWSVVVKEWQCGNDEKTICS